MDPSLQMKGPVRIVEIEGLDFNPCGGTHLSSLAGIGLIDSIALTEVPGKGFEAVYCIREVAS